MKKILLIVIVLFAIAPKTFAQNVDMTGIWRIEYTGDDADMDADTIVFKQSKHRIIGICLSYYYFDISNVEFDNGILTFTAVNSVDENEIYVLNYELRRKPNKTPVTFEGKFTNQKGVNATLKMVYLAPIPK